MRLLYDNIPLEGGKAAAIPDLFEFTSCKLSNSI
jgi:hypothetical protein